MRSTLARALTSSASDSAAIATIRERDGSHDSSTSAHSHSTGNLHRENSAGNLASMGRESSMGRERRKTGDRGEGLNGIDHHHETTHDHHHRVTEVLDAEFIHGDDFKTPLTPAQEEHFKLIFALNDHNGDGSIKVAELASFMGSLGHGLPAEQLEELIKDMGIDEDVDRSIFKDDFLTQIAEQGKTWRTIFREDFMELLRREGHSSRTIFLTTFLEFMRRALVADLPKSKLERIHALFRAEAETEAHRRLSFAAAPAAAPTPPAAVAIMPSSASAADDDADDEGAPLLTVGSRVTGTGGGDGGKPATPRRPAAKGARLGELSPLSAQHERMERERAASQVSVLELKPPTCGHLQVECILTRLGFHLDDVTFHELFDEVDGDGDGHIFEHEFVTMLGMLKRNLLEVMLLEESFTRFRAQRPDHQRSPGGMKLDEHAVYASDLVTALGVTELEAEEMIFIADLKDNQNIDFTEFKQVVVNWSG